MKESGWVGLSAFAISDVAGGAAFDQGNEAYEAIKGSFVEAEILAPECTLMMVLDIE